MTHVPKPRVLQIRLVVEASDYDEAVAFYRDVLGTEQLLGADADLIASPTTTPWESLNARLEGPGGLQLTVFQELGSGQAG